MLVRGWIARRQSIYAKDEDGSSAHCSRLLAERAQTDGEAALRKIFGTLYDDMCQEFVSTWMRSWTRVPGSE
jgi:hypothetical protein